MMKSGEGASHVLFPMNRMKSGENDGFHIDSHHISLKKCPLRWGQSISGNKNILRLVWIKNRYSVEKLRKPNWNTGRKTSLSSGKQVMSKHCYLLYFSFFFLFNFFFFFWSLRLAGINFTTHNLFISPSSPPPPSQLSLLWWHIPFNGLWQTSMSQLQVTVPARVCSEAAMVSHQVLGLGEWPSPSAPGASIEMRQMSLNSLTHCSEKRAKLLERLRKTNGSWGVMQSR